MIVMRAPRARLLLATVAGAFALTGCHSEAPTAVRGDNPNLYAALRTDVHAVTLAVNGTQALSATPLNSLQEPIAGTPAATFTSADTTRVTVTPDGVISAKATTITPVRIFASLPYSGTTRTDTVYVTVTPTAVTPDQFVLAPIDSTNLGLKSSTLVTGVVLTASGDTIEDVPVHYSSGNPQRATVNPSTGSIMGVSPGVVTIYASTTVYGTTYTDSIQYRITYQTSSYFYWYSGRWYPGPTVVIEPGSVLEFDNYSDEQIDIIFSDPGNVGAEEPGGPSGNIMAFASRGTTQTRRFPVPGTYTFYSSTAPDVINTIYVKSAAAAEP
jgi:hypothetical protein